MNEYEPNSQEKQMEGTADEVITDDYDANDRDTYMSESIIKSRGNQVGDDYNDAQKIGSVHEGSVEDADEETDGKEVRDEDADEETHADDDDDGDPTDISSIESVDAGDADKVIYYRNSSDHIVYSYK